MDQLKMQMHQLNRLLSTVNMPYREAYYVIYSDYPSVYSMIDLIKLSTNEGLTHIAQEANAELTELLKD